MLASIACCHFLFSLSPDVAFCEGHEDEEAQGQSAWKERTEGKREKRKVKKNEEGIALEKAARIIITRQEGGLRKVGRQKIRWRVCIAQWEDRSYTKRHFGRN